MVRDPIKELNIDKIGVPRTNPMNLFNLLRSYKQVRNYIKNDRDLYSVVVWEILPKLEMGEISPEDQKWLANYSPIATFLSLRSTINSDNFKRGFVISKRALSTALKGYKKDFGDIADKNDLIKDVEAVLEDLKFLKREGKVKIVS